MKTLGFFISKLCVRGTTIAAYDYAYYNEIILKNKSIILLPEESRLRNNQSVFFKFSRRFPIIFFDPENLEDVLEKESCDVLYMLKFGKNDNFYSRTIPTIVHCVFDMSDPHGTIYAGVSKVLANKFGQSIWVPHMINLDPLKGSRDDLRKSLNIPEDAIVFGRHGGVDTFNLDFAKRVISSIVNFRRDIYFLFINAPQWDVHDQIIYLDALTDLSEKSRFIRTCDAMIVPEQMGHTFGLSIGEFCVYNKPIIVYNGIIGNRNHLELLSSLSVKLFFKTEQEFFEILYNFSKDAFKNEDLNAYREYNPQEVMNLFNKNFLEPLNL